MSSTDFMGRNGFIWWVGVVENRFDPLYLGRVQVRILGWHTKNKLEMPTTELPWAYPLQPITSAAQTQVGTTPLGLVEGSWVMGFYRDGENGQEPVVMGSLGGIPELIANSNEGFNDPRGDTDFYDPYELVDGKIKRSSSNLENIPKDPGSVTPSSDGTGTIITEQQEKSTYPDARYINEPTTNRLARGIDDATSRITDNDTLSVTGDTIVQQKILNRQVGQVLIPRSKGGPTGLTPTFDEPITPYDALYPYNHVTQSESGHIIEVDDTPGNERLHWYHRAGTFKEIYPNGTQVDKVMNDRYNITMRNDFEHIENTKISTIDKGYEILVNADQELDNDYYLRVDGPGKLHGETESGVIEFISNNSDFNANAINITLTARDAITFNANTIQYNYKDVNVKVTNELNEISDGSRNITAGFIKLSSFSATSLSAKSFLGSISDSSEEIIRTLLPVTTNSVTKSTIVGFGQTKVTSRNYGLTGGISLEVENNGSPPALGISMSKIEMASTGDIEISSLATATSGNINLSTSGPSGKITVQSITGDVATSATVGNIETNALAGDIKATATKGDIKTEATAGDINVNAKLGKIDIVADAGSTTITSALKSTVEGQLVYLGADADQQVILGSKFLDKFLQHNHLSGTGPTGGVVDASPFIQTLSKKVFTQ